MSSSPAHCSPSFTLWDHNPETKLRAALLLQKYITMKSDEEMGEKNILQLLASFNISS